jgi:hypothetical protein
MRRKPRLAGREFKRLAKEVFDRERQKQAPCRRRKKIIVAVNFVILVQTAS